MDDQRLEEIAWRSQRAGAPCQCEYDGTLTIFRGRAHVAYVSNHQSGESGRDVAKFISASFKDVPDLLDDVKRMREALASQEEELAAFRRNEAVIRSEYGWKRDGRELPELIGEALRSLREERDAAVNSAKRVGRMADETVARALNRAANASAELQRLREGMRELTMRWGQTRHVDGVYVAAEIDRLVSP